MTPVETSTDDEAHRGDGDEHDVHRIAELLQRDRPHRGGRLAGDLVRAVAREPCLGFGGSQTRRRIRPQRRDDVPNLARIRRRLRRAGGPGGRLLVSIHLDLPPSALWASHGSPS